MDILGILGLLISVAVLMIGAYKGLGALPLTLIASLVVILTNGMPIWEGFSKHYMTGYTGAYMSYFLLFAFSSLYAEFMNISGAATAIGYSFIDWFGKGSVLLVSTLIISVLTYGGVSLFVVVFAVAPIMFLLFREANLPRHLTMACLITGSATYTMTALPGSTGLTNVIPSQFLPTNLIAAPVMGIIAAIAIFALNMAYMMRCEKKARINGDGWGPPIESLSGEVASEVIRPREELPSKLKSFLPLVVLVLIIIVGSRFVEDSTLLATVAMIIGAIITYLLNVDKFRDKNMKNIITKGLGGGISGIGGLAGVLAFGTVVQNSDAFKSIVEWVLSLQMNPYVQAVIATMVVSGVTGSSSGGLRIMYSSLAKNFLGAPVNFEVLHRITSLSAGALDTLPHSPGLFLMFSVLGTNHKQAYKHVFVCSVLVPFIVSVAATIVAVLFY